MKRNRLFEECKKNISSEVKREIELSFATVDRIHAILEKKGKTQADLARMLGKKESEISKWMRGTHNFTYRTTAKIEAVLGERIIEILGNQKQIEKEFIFIPIQADDYYKYRIEKKKAQDIPSNLDWNYGTIKRSSKHYSC